MHCRDPPDAGQNPFQATHPKPQFRKHSCPIFPRHQLVPVPSLFLMPHLHQLDEISRPGQSLASTLFLGSHLDVCAFLLTLSNNSTQLPSAVLVPFSIPLAQSCVLVFTTTLAELISPCLACPASGLLLAILFFLGLWLEGNFLLFYLCHTPVSAILSLGIMAWDYPCSLAPHVAWFGLFFGHPSSSLSGSYSCLCVPFTFHTSSMVTLLCHPPWCESVLSRHEVMVPPPLILPT